MSPENLHLQRRNLHHEGSVTNLNDRLTDVYDVVRKWHD
jgi:hypothetical protein